MATERVRALRRPKRPGGGPPVAVKSRGSTGLVLRGTRGIYDPDPNVRSQTARAMVGSRQRVLVSCKAPGCIDPKTGQPKVFPSRLVGGEPEKRACSAAHRLRLWRKDMQDKGYEQVTVDGQLGWRTPDGAFFPNPSQPARRRSRTGRRRRRRDAQSKSSGTGAESG